MSTWVELLDEPLQRRVNMILASANFIEPLKEVACGEDVLGEMTVLEKALYTAGRQIVNEAQPIYKTGTITPKEYGVYEAEYYRFRALKMAIRDLVYERLNLPHEVQLGFRQGFKIVKSRALKPQLQEKTDANV